MAAQQVRCDLRMRRVTLSVLLSTYLGQEGMYPYHRAMVVFVCVGALIDGVLRVMSE